MKKIIGVLTVLLFAAICFTGCKQGEEEKEYTGPDVFAGTVWQTKFNLSEDDFGEMRLTFGNTKTVTQDMWNGSSWFNTGAGEINYTLKNERTALIGTANGIHPFVIYKNNPSKARYNDLLDYYKMN
ncbi:MAG: hypothetical protein IKX23_07135 [Treponema sp.]|nr:hypothetical protein [Treponema sp.]